MAKIFYNNTGIKRKEKAMKNYFIRSACISESEKFRVIRNNQENEMPQKKKKIIYYMEKRDEMRVFVDHKEEKKWCNM